MCTAQLPTTQTNYLKAQPKHTSQKKQTKKNARFFQSSLKSAKGTLSNQISCREKKKA